MLKNILVILIALTISTFASASANVNTGDIAPKLIAKDTYGKMVNLKNYMGKIVVVEWTNHKCPYVNKHYKTKNMQTLQKYAKDNNVVWISVVTSKEGKAGYISSDKANKIAIDDDAVITHKIIDDGKIAKAFEAKTTPHMFVIDKNGKIAYSGAVDNRPSTRHSTVKGAKNYVMKAIDELLLEQEVTVKNTKPYGCAVKY